MEEVGKACIQWLWCKLMTSIRADFCRSATQENVYHMSCLNIIKLVMLVGLEDVEVGDVHEDLESHKQVLSNEDLFRVWITRWNESRKTWANWPWGQSWTQLKHSLNFTKSHQLLQQTVQKKHIGKAVVIRMVFEALPQPTSTPTNPFFFPSLSLSTSPPPPFLLAPVSLSCAGVNVSFLPRTNWIAFYIPMWYFRNAR